MREETFVATLDSAPRAAINPWQWQEPFGFSQAVAVDAPRRFVACSGQAAVDGEGRPLHPGDMAAQLKSTFDNLETLLEAGGFELADVVRLRMYVTDMGAYFAAQQVFIDRFAGRGIPVASTLLGVSALAVPGLLVEIEATAVR